MSEFNNRIMAQRKVLKLINGTNLWIEPIFSLSEQAIDRWSINNNISSSHSIILLLKSISGNLFFLANKSQEQITQDYLNLSNKIDNLVIKLKLEIDKMIIYNCDN